MAPLWHQNQLICFPFGEAAPPFLNTVSSILDLDQLTFCTISTCQLDEIHYLATRSHCVNTSFIITSLSSINHEHSITLNLKQTSVTSLQHKSMTLSDSEFQQKLRKNVCVLAAMTAREKTLLGMLRTFLTFLFRLYNCFWLWFPIKNRKNVCIFVAMTAREKKHCWEC
jgi:hypothetical protein